MKIAKDQREAILKEHLRITNLFVAEFAGSLRAYIKCVDWMGMEEYHSSCHDKKRINREACLKLISKTNPF